MRQSDQPGIPLAATFRADLSPSAPVTGKAVFDDKSLQIGGFFGTFTASLTGAA